APNWGPPPNLLERGGGGVSPPSPPSIFPPPTPPWSFFPARGGAPALGALIRFQTPRWGCLPALSEPEEGRGRPLRWDEAVGAAGNARRGRYRLRTRELFRLPALALSHLADDRLSCRGALARDRHRSRGARRCSLVRPRGGCEHAVAASSRRLDHAADHRHRLSHHPRLGGGRG